MRYGTAAKPNEDWCEVYKATFKHIFNRIKDLSYEDMKHINPSVRKTLIDLGYRSLSTIKEILVEDLVTLR